MKAEAHVDDLPHLRRRTGLGAGLRAVVQACVQRAGESRTHFADDEAVHMARRALKRARAGLRLAEALEVSGAKAARRRLARRARRLSPLRDATVVRRLAERCDGIALPDESPAQRDARGWTRWKRQLAAELPRLAALAWGRPAPHEFDRALKHFARRAGRRARRAQRASDIATAHEWRKAVIVFREQVQIARPLLGREADDVYAALHHLAHVLGRATDWNQFIGALRAAKAGRRAVARVKRKRKRALQRARRDWRSTRDVLAVNGFSVK